MGPGLLVSGYKIKTDLMGCGPFDGLSIGTCQDPVIFLSGVNLVFFLIHRAPKLRLFTQFKPSKLV